jgi:hypothetical protein
MCSNFGLNLHPDRKPCALQWEWYRFFNRLWGKLRNRYFPKALYMYGDGRGISLRSNQNPNQSRDQKRWEDQ